MFPLNATATSMTPFEEEATDVQARALSLAVQVSPESSLV
jgi:hypothetical protein